MDDNSRASHEHGAFTHVFTFYIFTAQNFIHKNTLRQQQRSLKKTTLQRTMQLVLSLILCDLDTPRNLGTPSKFVKVFAGCGFFCFARKYESNETVLNKICLNDLLQRSDVY